MYSDLASSLLRRSKAASLPLVMFAVVSVISATAVQSQEGEPERQFVLEGVDGVHVTVPAITGMETARGDIARAVEARISASGMKLISDNEYLNNTQVKSLVVRLNPLKQGGKTFFAINLDLTQMIYLPDRQSRKVDVSMWDDVSVGFVDTKKDSQIKEEVLKRVDRFIDMWRRANGKKAN